LHEISETTDDGCTCHKWIYAQPGVDRMSVICREIENLSVPDRKIFSASHGTASSPIGDHRASKRRLREKRLAPIARSQRPRTQYPA
jgi:hypothetical protein